MVHKVIKEAKNNYEIKIAPNSRKNSKNLWCYINKKWGILSNSYNTANAFNDFFVDIDKNLNKYIIYTDPKENKFDN